MIDTRERFLRQRPSVPIAAIVIVVAFCASVAPSIYLLTRDTAPTACVLQESRVDTDMDLDAAWGGAGDVFHGAVFGASK